MIIIGLLGFLFWLLAILGLALAGFLIFQGYQSDSWEPTRGKFKIEATPAILQRPDKGDEKRYKSTIKYLYKVDGEKYSGTRLAYGVVDVANYLTPQQAMTALSMNLDTEDFHVYYNPDNPNQSVVIQGIQWRVIGGIAGIALLLFIIGGLFISVTIV